MSKQAQNLKLLLSYFDQHNIPYAILGRNNSIQEIIQGDIDIVVGKNDFLKINLIMGCFCDKHNNTLIQCIQHEISAKYFVISDNDDHSMICPDICSDYMRDQRELIKSHNLLNKVYSTKVEGLTFKCLSNEYEFLYYLLKKISKGKITTDEFQHLYDKYNLSNKNTIKSKLGDYFSPRTVKIILDTFENNSLEELIKNKRVLKKELYKKKAPSTLNFFKNILLKIKRIRHKTGLSIAVMGPDGCGKSTVIDALEGSIVKAFRGKEYYHLMPVKAPKNQITNSNPQGQTPYTLLLAQVKLIYLVIKYNIGFLKIYIQLIKSKLVIFDRYFDDITIDKLRFRYKGPTFLLNLASLFVPKPAIYIYLKAPSNIIYERKKELDIVEIERQQNSYLKLLKKKNNAFIVNADQEIESVIFETEKIILQYLKKRFKNRQQ